MKRSTATAVPFVPWAYLGILALALPACGTSVPVPKYGPHKAEEATTVPYPPPPAQVEVVPAPPADMKGKNPIWVDGEWQWRSRRWVWQPGQWEVPYPGSYYAPPTTIRLADGTLLYYPGDWKLAKQGQ